MKQEKILKNLMMRQMKVVKFLRNLIAFPFEWAGVISMLPGLLLYAISVWIKPNVKIKKDDGTEKG